MLSTFGCDWDEKFPTAAKGLGKIIHCQERVIVNAVMPFTILIVPGPTSRLRQK